MKRNQIAVLLAAMGLTLAQPANAVVLNQIDDFEDGTTANWTANILGMGVHPAPPANVPSGGPGGFDDNYLQLTSVGGAGAGSRLVAINLGQWAGDYTAAGVTHIEMSVRNLGSTDLALRLLFEDPAGGPPTNVAISSDAMLVPGGSDWIDIIFPVAASDLTALTGSVAAVLSNTTALRILHSASGLFPGEPVIGQLGVDDIAARAIVEVPEPAAMALLGFAIVGIAGLRRRRG